MTLLPFQHAPPPQRRHLEDNLQMQVCDYLARVCPVFFWAVPNGGVRNPREAARLKRMGVRPGVFDLHFLLDEGRLGVIELKVKPNGLTPEQKIFQSWVLESGGSAATCYSIKDVYDTLVSWDVKLPRSVFA